MLQRLFNVKGSQINTISRTRRFPVHRASGLPVGCFKFLKLGKCQMVKRGLLIQNPIDIFTVVGQSAREGGKKVVESSLPYIVCSVTFNYWDQTWTHTFCLATMTLLIDNNICTATSLHHSRTRLAPDHDEVQSDSGAVYRRL
jgi:hypothetical protein